jgi:hypothetical protein
MTRRSLSCFTWLLLASSLWPGVRGQSLPTGARGVDEQQAIDRGLPCSDSSAECLRRLGDLAAENCAELRVISQALAYQRRKLWTSWFNADGLNPLAVGLRVARNLAGGGDRAAARLAIAELERRRAEVEAGLRLAVAERVAELEAAARRLGLAREREAAHQSRLSLSAVGYRIGEGSTEEMMVLWQTREEMRGRVAEAAADSAWHWARLRALLAAPTPEVTRTGR